MQNVIGTFIRIGIVFVLFGAGIVVLNVRLNGRRRSLSDQLLERPPKASPVISPPILRIPLFQTSRSSSPTRLTTELLNQLEWRRFEILVTVYFNNTGTRATRSRVGAEGGVDIYLYRDGEGRTVTDGTLGIPCRRPGIEIKVSQLV